MIRTAPFLVATVLLLSAYSGAFAQGRHPVGLRALALHKSDLPQGAERGSTRFWTNTQAATRDGVPVSLYDQHGRVNSYQDNFSRPLIGGLSFTGKVVIVGAGSEVTRFASRPGAHWYFVRLRAATRHGGVFTSTTGGTHFGQGRTLAHYHRSPLPSVGGEASAFIASWAGDEFAYTTRVILFRRGRYVMYLRVDGLQKELPPAAVAALAQKLDRRVRILG